MSELVTITVTKPVSDLLSSYSDNTGMGYGECLSECLVDYLGVISNVKSRHADKGLKLIFNEFEINVKKLIDFMKVERKKVVDDIYTTRILTGEDLYKDNVSSIPRKIPKFIYDNIKKTLERHPYMYNKKKKAKVVDLVDRSIFFRIIKNDELMNNLVYQEWRLQRLFHYEKQSKLEWDYLFKNINW